MYNPKYNKLKEGKKKMKEEKKIKISTLIIIILSLLLICTTSYIIYDKIIKVQNIDNEDNITKDKENNQDNIEDKKISISEEEVKNIYYNILNYCNIDKIYTRNINSGFGYDYLLELYTDGKVTTGEDLSYESKMTIAYLKLAKENKISTTSKEYNTIRTINIADIKEAYKFYFGEKIEIKEFSNYQLGNCIINDINYICTNGPGGGEGSPFSLITTFDSFETTNSEILVYEKAIYHDSETNKYYLDRNSKNEVTELANQNTNIILDDTYKNKLMMYLHTFKQNSDGSFYLYSTELIK